MTLSFQDKITPVPSGNKLSFADKITPVNKSVDTKINSQEPGVSFSANKDDSTMGGVFKMLGNFPSSAYKFAKGAIGALNPVNTFKTLSEIPSEFNHLVKESGGVENAIGATAKEILPTAYGALVPKATQQVISGDYEGARQTLTNDPIGQILPYILLGRGVANKAGYGEQFDNAISTIAKPVTSTASRVANLGSTLAKQTLGASTGAGASSIEEAANHSRAFTDAMRGKINPDDVVQTAQDAVSKIAENRRTQYVSDLQKIGEQKGSLDISPVQDTLQTQLKNFGVNIGKDGELDFSRSSIANNGSARADIQGVFNTLKDWGTKEGDRTPIGLDTLKKQLGDFYSDSGSARSFVQAVKSKVSGILKDQVPGYEDMTKNYGQASQLLDDIKSATGVGGKAKIDTVFTKLTSALKNDKQLRLDILKEVEAQGSQPDLMAKIAGSNMQSYLPKGLVGKLDIGAGFGILTHFFSPQFIPALLATSPRIVGEFVRALGIGADKAALITNTINSLQIPTAGVIETSRQDKNNDFINKAEAKESPSISTIKNEIALRETRGEKEPYTAVNNNSNGTSDYGKYQVNEQVLKTYSKKFLGKEITPEQFLADPDIQEKFFDRAMEHLKSLGAKSLDAFLILWHKGWSDPSTKRLNELRKNPSVQAYLKKP